MKTDVRIVAGSFSQYAEGIRRVRETVFVTEQNVPLELEWDGLDDSASHMLALSPDNQAIGTGRLLPDGHIGRMAVLKSWRNQGIGSAILLALCELARQQGHKRVELSAQTHACAFYEKHGFTATGEIYLDADIPHRNMYLILTG